jgi:hypothetical protein
MKKPLTAEDALDLVGGRMAIRLSMLVKNKTFGGFPYEEKRWRRELAAIDAELLEAGLLKPVEGAEDVGEADLGEVVTLRGNPQEAEAPESGSANRPCEFCGGTGEKIVDMEIGGFMYEMVVDCHHPYA